MTLRLPSHQLSSNLSVPVSLPTHLTCLPMHMLGKIPLPIRWKDKQQVMLPQEVIVTLSPLW